MDVLLRRDKRRLQSFTPNIISFFFFNLNISSVSKVRYLKRMTNGGISERVFVRFGHSILCYVTCKTPNGNRGLVIFCLRCETEQTIELARLLRIRHDGNLTGVEEENNKPHGSIASKLFIMLICDRHIKN